MKALSLIDDNKKNPHPWLTMIEYEVRDIETRRRWLYKAFRGDLLLCASASSKTPNAGHAVCVVSVADIVPMTPQLERRARIKANPHTSALLLTNLRWLSHKFPVKGRLGLYDVTIPDDVKLIPREGITPKEYPPYLLAYLQTHPFPI